MSSPDQFAADIRYVRQVVDRSRMAYTGIWLLWAALGSVGFALNDFAPSVVPTYWLFAGPGGGILSAWLGRRAQQAQGVADRASGLRWMLHFFGMLTIIGLALVSAALAVIPVAAINGVILLILIGAYYTAAVHLDGRLYWVAGALALTVPALALLPSYGWTIGGALTGLTLVAVAARGRSRA